jgi:hypothetical protein
VATQCWTACGLLDNVREVIFVEETGYPICERLSPGERVHGGSENSWKESCSYHRARRLLVRSVAEAQGKGGQWLMDCLGDIEGVYSWGGIDTWGMRVYGRWA